MQWNLWLEKPKILEQEEETLHVLIFVYVYARIKGVCIGVYATKCMVNLPVAICIFSLCVDILHLCINMSCITVSTRVHESTFITMYVVCISNHTKADVNTAIFVHKVWGLKAS